MILNETSHETYYKGPLDKEAQYRNYKFIFQYQIMHIDYNYVFSPSTFVSPSIINS